MTKKPKVTKQYLCDGISRSLVDFGYPDASPAMIGEIYDAYLAGKRGNDLPHSIVGRFAERQIEEAEELLGSLPVAP